MSAGMILQEINTDLGYNFYECGYDCDWVMLTHTRYDEKAMKSPLKAAYFASKDGLQVFKMTMVEVEPSELPSKERKALDEVERAFDAENDDDE